jgi:hypothetical protein
MAKRFATWIYLTFTLSFIGVALGAAKIWLVHVLSSSVPVDLHQLTSRNICILIGGAILLSGLGAFFIILATWLWPEQFSLHRKCARKSD